MSAMQQLIKILTASIDAKVITVTELAAIAGCSRQYIYNVLQGKQCPSVAMAEQLASAVGVTLKLVTTRKEKKISA